MRTDTIEEEIDNAFRCGRRDASNFLSAVEKVISNTGSRHVEIASKARCSRDLCDSINEARRELGRNSQDFANIALNAAKTYFRLDKTLMEAFRRASDTVEGRIISYIIAVEYQREESRFIENDKYVSERDIDDYRSSIERMYGKFRDVVKAISDNRVDDQDLHDLDMSDRNIDVFYDHYNRNDRGGRDNRRRDSRDSRDDRRPRRGEVVDDINDLKVNRDRQEDSQQTKAAVESKPVEKPKMSNVSWTPSIHTPHPICQSMSHKCRFIISGAGTVVQVFADDAVNIYLAERKNMSLGTNIRVHGLTPESIKNIEAQRKAVSELDENDIRVQEASAILETISVVNPIVEDKGEVEDDGPNTINGIFPSVQAPVGDLKDCLIEVPKTSTTIKHIDVRCTVAHTLSHEYIKDNNSSGVNKVEYDVIRKIINDLKHNSDSILDFSIRAHRHYDQLDGADYSQKVLGDYCDRVSARLHEYCKMMLSEPRIVTFDITNTDDIKDMSEGKGLPNAKEWVESIWVHLEAVLHQIADEESMIDSFNAPRWQLVGFSRKKYIAAADISMETLDIKYPENIAVGAAVTTVIHKVAAKVFSEILLHIPPAVICNVMLNDQTWIKLAKSPITGHALIMMG